MLAVDSIVVSIALPPSFHKCHLPAPVSLSLALSLSPLAVPSPRSIDTHQHMFNETARLSARQITELTHPSLLVPLRRSRTLLHSLRNVERCFTRSFVHESAAPAATIALFYTIPLESRLTARRAAIGRAGGLPAVQSCLDPARPSRQTKDVLDKSRCFRAPTKS